MKAVVYDRYGPPEVLRIEEVARPVPRGTTRSWSGSAPPRSIGSTATPVRPTAATAFSSAARYVETQQKIGNVVLAVIDS